MAVPRSALSLFRNEPVESHALDGLDAFAKCQLPTASSSRRTGARPAAGMKSSASGSSASSRPGLVAAAVDIRGEAAVDLGIGSQLAKAVGERREGGDSRRTFTGKTIRQIQEERRSRRKEAAAVPQQPAAAPAAFRATGWAGRRAGSAIAGGGGATATGSFPSLGGLASRQQAHEAALQRAGAAQAASGRWALQHPDDESDEEDAEEEATPLLGSEEVLPPAEVAAQSPAEFAQAIHRALDNFSMGINVDKFVDAAGKTMPADGLGARHQVVMSVLTQTFDPSIWEERAVRKLPELMLALLERHVVDARMFRVGVSLALEQLPGLRTDYPKADEQVGRVLSAVAMKDHRLLGALPALDGLDLGEAMGDRARTAAMLEEARAAAAAVEAEKEAARQERVREKEERRRQMAAKAQAMEQGVTMPVGMGAGASSAAAGGGGAGKEEEEARRREREAEAEAARKARAEKAAAAAAERRRRREEADEQARVRAAEVAEVRKRKEAAARARVEAEAAAAMASAALAAAPRGDFDRAAAGATEEAAAAGGGGELDDLYASAKPKGKKKKKSKAAGEEEGSGASESKEAAGGEAAAPSGAAGGLEDLYAAGKTKGKKKKKKSKKAE